MEDDDDKKELESGDNKIIRENQLPLDVDNKASTSTSSEDIKPTPETDAVLYVSCESEQFAKNITIS